MQCCAPCLQSLQPKAPGGLSFANSPGSAVGDSKVPHNRRLMLGIVFPEDAHVPPMWMYFSKSSEGTKVLEAACGAAGIKLDRGRIVGSPERLNLFTSEGDLLRVDLDLEAHLGTTLQPNSMLILEKGNRVEPERLANIQEMQKQQAAGAGACVIM